MLTLISNEAGRDRFKLTSGTAAVDLRNLPPGHGVVIETPFAGFNIDSAGYYRIELTDIDAHLVVRRGGDATITLADGTRRRIAPNQEALD